MELLKIANFDAKIINGQKSLNIWRNALSQMFDRVLNTPLVYVCFEKTE